MESRLKKVLLRSKTIHRIRLILAQIPKTVRGFFVPDHSRDMQRVQLMHSDVIRLTFKPKATLRVKTDYPIAYESDDHKFPAGSMQDNTRSPRFVRACERYFGRKLKVADLGCSGGGLVLDFLLEGHDAYGVEGSDFSQKTARAEWRTIPNHLFTADIAKPFAFIDEANKPAQLDLITAWEVLEHLEEPQLEKLFQNIKNNLNQDGVFMGSVACFESLDPLQGAIYHKTVQPKNWWLNFVQKQGFEVLDVPFVNKDFPRGPGIDWDPARLPDNGFHLVCKPRSA